MVTEILHERTLRPVDVQAMIDFVKVHLSLEELHSRVRIDSQIDATIHANKHLLSRALINIIDNGLQATDIAHGRVDVQTYEEQGEVVFRISDNGRGIPRDALDKIWELGYTNGKSTGLGLNFVRQVVNDHHGDIRISSQVGVGTTVRIGLPRSDVDDGKKSSSG
jgi:signal transduction histidine kinase